MQFHRERLDRCTGPVLAKQLFMATDVQAIAIPIDDLSLAIATRRFEAPGALDDVAGVAGSSFLDHVAPMRIKEAS